MEYQAGMSWHAVLKGENGEMAHVCLYGDVHHEVAPWAMEAATAMVPDQAALADHQKWSVCFELGRIRQYGEVRGLFTQVAERLEAAGWSIAPAIEGYPDTGCTIDGLVDTDGPSWWGKPEADWPREPAVEGHNAACGFRVVVERPGTKPEFTADEIAEIRRLAVEAIRLVFGKDLEEVTLS